MRMAFLPVMALLASGAAWGQSAANVTAPVILRTQSPVVLQAAQWSSAQPLVLTAPDAQGPLRLLAPRSARHQTSGPEQIPTQWPHAKLEPIPTQWKAQVVLVGGGPARPAGASAAGAVVSPR